MYARFVPATESVLAGLSSPVVDTAPADFIRALPVGADIHADHIEVINGYLGSSDVMVGRSAMLEMSEPLGASLYEFALECGGFGATRPWSELRPVYLRQDPATSKYPEGYNRV